MKKRKGSLLQRMLAVLLAAVLVTGMAWDAVPASVLAQADNTASGDGWVLDADGKLTISSDEGMADWENYMRGDYEYYTRQVVNVEIQDGVTSLGNNAFFNYGELTGITIADSVTSIAGSAFSGCWKLRKITIPNNVTSISDRMFMNSGLEEITIPGSVTSIGEFAFWGCGLTKITIPDSVKSIGEKAFIYCDNLNKVIIKSETPPTLGDGVFTDCGFVKDNTQSIHVPEGKAQAYKTAWTDWAAYIADGTHTHSWLSDWTSNETHHWHECTVSDCPITGNADKDGYGAHIYDNDSDTDCNTCGYERTAAATEIVGIEVDCDLTSARAAQIGDNLVRPGASVTLNPETASQAAPSWLKKEDSGFTEYKGNTWEEGTYVREVEVTIYEGYIFAAELQITSPTGENWTVVERSDDNRTIVLRSDEIVKTARPHTHDLTLTPAKDATCTEDGNTAYYVCGGNDGCGKWFSDAEGTQEITNHDNVVIFKTGHSYDESAWGYTGADGHAHKCRNCNEHSIVQAHTPGAAATETTPQTCTVCGYELSPTIGHTHNYGDWQHDSTQHWKVCSCGDETGRGNHDYGDWITDQAATATETGTRHRDCQTCGYSQTETIPATGGDPGSGTVTPEVKPGTNAPATNISTSTEELKDMLLTDDEKQQVQNGTNIRIVLEVQDAGNTVSVSDRAAVAQALNGYTVGQYLDIDLYKLVGTDRTDITETAKKIRIVITVPDSLKNADSSKTRAFAVIRVHDGGAELLADLDDSADTITIETDRFSTYGIVYQDNGTAPTEKPLPQPTVTPPRPDNTPKPDESGQTGNQIEKRKDLSLLLATGKQSGKSGIKLSWTKCKNISGYEVYWSYCDGKNNYKKAKTIKASGKRAWTHRKLKTNRTYKYFIAAYKMVDGKKYYITKSPAIHVAMRYDRQTNIRKIKVNKTKAILKKGKTFRIKAKLQLENRKKKALSHVAKLRYYTDNSKVAVVSKKGKITAKGRGTCTVYVIANNGVSKKIKVTVK